MRGPLLPWPHRRLAASAQPYQPRASKDCRWDIYRVETVLSRWRQGRHTQHQGRKAGQCMAWADNARGEDTEAE
jgi:hypothetical protein